MEHFFPPFTCPALNVCHTTITLRTGLFPERKLKDSLNLSKQGKKEAEERSKGAGSWSSVSVDLWKRSLEAQSCTAPSSVCISCLLKTLKSICFLRRIIIQEPKSAGLCSNISKHIPSLLCTQLDKVTFFSLKLRHQTFGNSSFYNSTIWSVLILFKSLF